MFSDLERHFHDKSARVSFGRFAEGMPSIVFYYIAMHGSDTKISFDHLDKSQTPDRDCFRPTIVAEGQTVLERLRRSNPTRLILPIAPHCAVMYSLNKGDGTIDEKLILYRISEKGVRNSDSC